MHIDAMWQCASPEPETALAQRSTNGLTLSTWGARVHNSAIATMSNTHTLNDPPTHPTMVSPHRVGSPIHMGGCTDRATPAEVQAHWALPRVHAEAVERRRR
jgi:hypothetical protein